MKNMKKLFTILLVLALVMCGTLDYGMSVSAEESVEEENITEFREYDPIYDATYFERKYGQDICYEVGDEWQEGSACERLNMEYKITGKTEKNYTIEVTMENVSSNIVDDWEVQFELKNKIEKIKGAKLISYDGKENYTITGENVSQDMEVNERLTFEITAANEKGMLLPKYAYLTKQMRGVEETDYSVKYIQNGKWEGHVNGQVIITNTGDTTIHDWKFDLKVEDKISKIENIWNAKLATILFDKCCEIDNADYNQDIEPGQSVTFGFIAKTDTDIEVVETRLYKMQEVEYVKGIYTSELPDMDDDDWTPYYDRSFFETEEEYAEYLEDIGVGYYPVMTYAVSNSKKYYVEPFIKYKLKIDNGDKKKLALQSYLWQGDTLLSLYADKENSISSAFLCQTNPNSSGGYTIKQSDNLKMIGFAHGQSFESFTRTVNGKDYNTFMMCAGASSEFAKNVTFLKEKAILGKTGKYSYNSSDCKKITGLGYAGASSTSVKRVDAALSADEKILGVWCKISDDRAQISLYDMSVIKKYLYEKGNSTYAMSTDELRYKALITTTTEDLDYLLPNDSFQSMEVSNAFGEDKNKWKVYITSGNESKNKALTISCLTIKKGAAKVSKVSQIHVETPRDKYGEEIFSGTCELEGCHIEGEDLRFLFTKSNNENKTPQYIVAIKKDRFSDEEAIIKS